MANKLSARFATESNKTYTENGAETFASSGNAVLDFFYLAPARQGMDNLDLFDRAYQENPILALKAAFYLRDVRQGKGQRNTFRDVLRYLSTFDVPVFEALVPYVAEYGRWDDILEFVTNRVVVATVFEQLKLDMNDEHPSLLGKWLPSENTSSRDTRRLATAWRTALGLSPRSYRKLLSDLRRQIGIVETKMSSGKWDSINYEHVPSRAMKLYRKAFGRHDPLGFDAYITGALSGEKVIHSSGLYPHEIVHPFMSGHADNKALEAMWAQLPNFFGDVERRVLPIVDVSGSMMQPVAAKSSVLAIDVSIGLGLYCAERNIGPFQNFMMTFSGRPQIVHIEGKNLRTRVMNVQRMNWAMNTDIQAAFKSLLRMAKRVGASPDEMPTNLLIISDMEFNACARGTNLDGIRAQYAAAGYELPLVTFWNVMGRNKQTPATQNDTNVFLVSGFSAETVGKVLNAEAVTPEGLMLEILNSERYEFIDKLIA